MKRKLDISMEISRHQNAEKVDLGNEIYMSFLSPKSAETISEIAQLLSKLKGS